MTLSPELMQAIMNYLANKPYAEVFQIINAIQAEASAKADDKAQEL